MPNCIIKAQPGDVVVAKLSCEELAEHVAINVGDEWKVEALDGLFAHITREGMSCWMGDTMFADIFEDGYDPADIATEPDPIDYEALCKDMESTLKGIIFGTSIWCEKCADVMPRRNVESGELVCDKCGAGEGWTDKVEFGDETNEYVVTYELNSALWDREYLSIEVYDWINHLFFDPSEGVIRAYEKGWKENLMFEYGNVDNELCDRLYAKARESIANWTKDPESWKPTL